MPIWSELVASGHDQGELTTDVCPNMMAVDLAVSYAALAPIVARITELLAEPHPLCSFDPRLAQLCKQANQVMHGVEMASRTCAIPGKEINGDEMLSF